MLRMMLLALVFGCGAAGGYFYARSHPAEVTYSAGSIIPLMRNELGCQSPASAAVFGSLDGRSVSAFGGASTDTAAIKIDYTAKQISLLSGAGLKAGFSDGDIFRIHHDSENTVAAVQLTPRGAVHVLMIKKKTGQVMWTKTADLLGLSGQSIFLECR